MTPFRTSRGRPTPLGPSLTPDGANFALLCRHGTAVTLVILPAEGGSTPLAEIAARPAQATAPATTGTSASTACRTRSATAGGWTARTAPRTGSTRRGCSSTRPPPCSRTGPSGPAPARSTRTAPPAAACTAAAPGTTGTTTPRRSSPYEDSIIYELHVRGFTCHPSSGRRRPRHVPRAGREDPVPEVARRHRRRTAAGLRVRRVRLPVLQPGDGREADRTSGATTPIAFAAPKAAFAASAKQHGQTHEFRDMVKAFHAAGIEVILDVVFNHTGEGDDRGRTYSLPRAGQRAVLPAGRRTAGT